MLKFCPDTGRVSDVSPRKSGHYGASLREGAKYRADVIGGEHVVTEEVYRNGNRPRPPEVVSTWATAQEAEREARRLTLEDDENQND